MVAPILMLGLSKGSILKKKSSTMLRKKFVILFLIAIQFWQVAVAEKQSKNVTSKASRRLNSSEKRTTISPTTTTTTLAVPSFTVEDFSRYVESVSEPIVVDISEVNSPKFPGQEVTSSKNVKPDVTSSKYFRPEVTSSKNNKTSANFSNDDAADAKTSRNVERDAGNYAYYNHHHEHDHHPHDDHHHHGQWHPVQPVIVPHQPLPQHIHPALVVHPATPTTTTEASNVFHYTIKYEVTFRRIGHVLLTFKPRTWIRQKNAFSETFLKKAKYILKFFNTFLIGKWNFSNIFQNQSRNTVFANTWFILQNVFAMNYIADMCWMHFLVESTFKLLIVFVVIFNGLLLAVAKIVLS